MKKFLVKIALLYFAILGPTIIPSIILLIGIGHWRTSFDLLLLLSISLCSIGVFLNLIRLFIKKHRSNAFQYLGAFLITGLLIIPNLVISEKIRLHAFYLAGLRAEPIIVAIEKYYDENGRPPEKLENLIPEHISSIPSRIPEFRISKANEKGTWSLTADTGTGLLNWDEFIYRSNQDYSSTGDPIKKLGKWGYIFE